MKRALLVSILFLASNIVAATNSSEPVQYISSVNVETSTAELEVTSKLVIPVDVLASGQARLFLNKNFTVVGIAGESLADYSVGPSKQVPIWNEIMLDFAGSSNALHEVILTYEGVLDNDAGDGNFITDSGIHLSIDSAWHPFFADFSTKLRGKLSINLPKGWRVYAPGVVTRSDDQYQIAASARTIDVSLYATSAVTEIAEKNFNVVYDEHTGDTASSLVLAGSQCMQALNEKFGEGEALESANLVLLNRPGPSFARGNYLSVSSRNLTSETQSYQYICHELAHNWTTVGNAMSHDYWMAESFAEYVAAKELKAAFGAEAYEEVVTNWQARAKGQPFVWRAENDQRASPKVNYGLGPLALVQLEENLGNETFAELVHWYMTEPVHRTEELLSQIETLSGTETSHWFEALLEGRK